jgi:hypothetical protein
MNAREVLWKHVRYESNDSEQGPVAEFFEHEKETRIPQTQNLMTSQVSLCKEESAACSSSK